MLMWETPQSRGLFLPKELELLLSSVQGGHCGVKEHRGVAGAERRAVPA